MGASQAAEYVNAALQELGYDPDQITSLHVSRRDGGPLEAVLTVLDNPRSPRGGTHTEIVHLGG